jgi:hypothetical protein
MELKNSKTNGLNIFAYSDFRPFLTDWRKYMKKLNPSFTQAAIGEVLKVNNRGYYFRALVGFNQPTTPLQKEYWFEQLILLNHTPRKIVDEDTYDFYKDWYHNTERYEVKWKVQK